MVCPIAGSLLLDCAERSADSYRMRPLSGFQRRGDIHITRQLYAKTVLEMHFLPTYIFCRSKCEFNCSIFSSVLLFESFCLTPHDVRIANAIAPIISLFILQVVEFGKYLYYIFA